MIRVTTRSFGPTGRSVAVIGQGTWDLERAGRRQAVAALQRGLELGLTHIDTAELYGSGAAEEIVGEALAGRRGQAFVTSKVLPQHASAAGLARACEASLKRLAIEQLDLYLLHSPSSRFPLAETIGAFESLVRDGKIAAWGVSNFEPAELQSAVELAGPGRVACNQVLYNLGTPEVEHSLLPLCARERVALVGYSPFAALPPARSRPGQALAEVARDRGQSLHQVVLAFLTRLDGTFAIPKAAQHDHVGENAAVASAPLEPAQRARIEEALSAGTG